MGNAVKSEMLMGFVERLEVIGKRTQECKDDKGVVVAEIKAAGLTPKLVEKVVKARQRSPSEIQEANALHETYMAAAGMMPEPPLFRAVGMLNTDIAVRESVIEAMKKLVPVNGSIQIKTEGGKPVELKRGPDGIVTVSAVVAEEKAPAPAPAKPVKKPEQEVPDATEKEADKMGFDAARSNFPAIRNPFPYGDKRRGIWDAGWRRGAGSDGMGPEG